MPSRIYNNPKVIEAYLGKEEDIATLLAVENLTVAYGAVEALKGISLEIQEGHVVAVLGEWGGQNDPAQGHLRPGADFKSGKISLKGEDLSRYLAYQLAGMGVVHIPEGRRVFATLSVEENLNLGSYSIRKTTSRQALQKSMDWVFELFPQLKERKRQLAGTLSGGEQQMLARTAAAWWRDPKSCCWMSLRCLAPILVQEIFQVIRQIHMEEGVTILLVEQNARKALGIADYGYILETGKIAIQDTAGTAGERAGAGCVPGGRAVPSDSQPT